MPETQTNGSKAGARAPDILLVEDNPSDAELSMRSLRKNNLANGVHWVKDGAEALDYLFAQGAYAKRDLHETPSVVILDIKLPKVDGIEVLRRVKSDDRTRAIPVVIMTSSREERDMIESYRLGVNSYVVKPVDFDQFARAVSELGLYWMLINQPLR
jgi:two-component system response regulator